MRSTKENSRGQRGFTLIELLVSVAVFILIAAAVYQGFAFGPGLERIIMMKYNIPDVRLLHSGDIRFVYAFEEKSI